MTRSIKILTTLMTVVLLSSFTDKTAPDFSGTYGVSESDPAQIKLTIHSDHTFDYQDFSIPAKKIDIKGNWTQKGGKVVLTASSSVRKFHNVWSFEENGQVAKSRRGLTFYRLCKIGLRK